MTHEWHLFLIAFLASAWRFIDTGLIALVKCRLRKRSKHRQAEPRQAAVAEGACLSFNAGITTRVIYPVGFHSLRAHRVCRKQGCSASNCFYYPLVQTAAYFCTWSSAASRSRRRRRNVVGQFVLPCSKEQPRSAGVIEWRSGSGCVKFSNSSFFSHSSRWECIAVVERYPWVWNRVLLVRSVPVVHTNRLWSPLHLLSSAVAF